MITAEIPAEQRQARDLADVPAELTVLAGEPQRLVDQVAGLTQAIDRLDQWGAVMRRGVDGCGGPGKAGAENHALRSTVPRAVSP